MFIEARDKLTVFSDSGVGGLIVEVTRPDRSTYGSIKIHPGAGGIIHRDWNRITIDTSENIRKLGTQIDKGRDREDLGLLGAVSDQGNFWVMSMSRLNALNFALPASRALRISDHNNTYRIYFGRDFQEALYVRDLVNQVRNQKN